MNSQRTRAAFWRRAPLAAAVIALGTGCGGSNDAPKTPLSDLSSQPAADERRMPHDALIALDSGNALYRLKKYADALVQYRLAAKRAPDDGAAYFGIYMVADVTKNRPLLDSTVATLKAKGMSPPMGAHPK